MMLTTMRARAFQALALPVHALAVVAVMLLFAGCAINPVTRMPRLVALTEREEVKVGKEALLELRRSHAFIDEGPAAAMVDAHGQELAAIASGPIYPYSFDIMDAAEANAFALPGGFVVVTRGMLLLCNNGDELAGVLGHEIGHVSARHAATRLAWAMPAEALGSIVRLAVGVVDDQEAEALGAGLSHFLLAPYDRSLEREADRIGVVLAGSVGYDADALADTLARLAQARPDGTELKTTLFASHPPTPERLELIRIVAAELERSTRETPDDYLSAIDGLTVGASPARGILTGATILIPEWDAALRLPDGWVYEVGDGNFVAVADAGAAVLRVRVQQLADAAREREGLRREDGFVELTSIPAPAPWQATRGILRHGDAGDATARFYWLVSDTIAVQLSGTWTTADDARYGALADGVLASLRAPTASELDALEIVRLRLVTAAPGESLAELVRRTGSVWSPRQVAFFNGLDVEEAAPPGRILKIALREKLQCTPTGAGQSCR